MWLPEFGVPYYFGVYARASVFLETSICMCIIYLYIIGYNYIYVYICHVYIYIYVYIKTCDSLCVNLLLCLGLFNCSLCMWVREEKRRDKRTLG